MTGFYFKIDARKQVEQGAEVTVVIAGRVIKCKPIVIPKYWHYDGVRDEETIIY
jgi:hypothetical protein